MTSLNLANTKQERAGDAGKDFEFVNGVIEDNIAKVADLSSKINLSIPDETKYSLNGFQKSSPPQNRQLIVDYY